MENSAKLVIDAIRPLAEKIGEGAAHLYEVYTKQVVVEGITTLIIAGFCLLAIPVGIWFWRLGYKQYVSRKDKREATGEGFVWIGVLLTAAATFGLITSTVTGIQQLVNPEYTAIQRIICQAKGNCGTQ